MVQLARLTQLVQLVKLVQLVQLAVCLVAQSSLCSSSTRARMGCLCSASLTCATATAGVT
jgi:hypothetical protein